MKITKNLKVEQGNSSIFSMWSSCPSWLLARYFSFTHNRNPLFHWLKMKSNP